jgi:hypothetical protein
MNQSTKLPVPLFAPTPDRPIVEHAAFYAARNDWCVFPSPHTGEKKGIYFADKSNGYMPWGQTKNTNNIAWYWEDNPKANVCIATGAMSGIFVVDLDTKEGHASDGIASMADLEAEHGPLPMTRQAISPSGSIHYYFRHPGGKIKNSESQIAPGIDIRGDGGMVLAPPSVKPGKGAYRWLNDLPAAEAPQWLLDKIDAVKDEAEPEIETAPELSISDRALATVKAPPPNPFLEQRPSYQSDGYSRAYLDTALNDERAIVARTAKGRRNAQLNKSSFNLGQLVAHGLGEGEIIDAMMDAATACGHLKDEGRKQTMATIRSGLMDGKASPRALPQGKSTASQGSDSTVNPTAGQDNDPTVGQADESDKVTPTKKYIVSSSEFLAGFVPPDYLVDGILQRRFIYSMTAPTGTGKTAMALMLSAHVALGRNIGDIEVDKGRVLYLAGENPDDVRMRWLASAEKLGFDSDTVDVHFLPGVFRISEIYQRVYEEVQKIGPVALVIVDTSAAYFEGDDINADVPMGKHARLLRTLLRLPGEPCVVVCCHPVKNATPDNMVPKGGGAFLNEVDGNLTCAKVDSLVTLHWQSKYRGPDFAPMAFELHTVTTERLKDSKGRPIPSVVAMPMSEEQRGQAEAVSMQDEDNVLLQVNGSRSMTDIAMLLNWTIKGKPNKSKVQRIAKRLTQRKLVTIERRNLVLTEKGKKEVKQVKEL